jgi:ADP-heptose:LPS heptosyltransferase
VKHLKVTPVTTDYVGLVKCSPFDVENVRDCLLKKGLNRSESYAVLAPAASKYRRHKEWPDDGWEQLAGAMLDSGLRPVFVGAAHEGALSARRAKGVIDLSGETSLMELAALLQMATVFVGIDSGAMHLAAAMDTPVVGLFGPTSPEFTGPLGNKSRVIYHPECCTCVNRNKCHNPSCLRSITVEEVMDEVSSLLTVRRMTQVV